MVPRSGSRADTGWTPEIPIEHDAGRHARLVARAGAPRRTERPHAPRADHRHHRAGRLVPGRAAAGQGLRGVGHGAPRRPPSRTSASSTSATGSRFVQADLLDQPSLTAALQQAEPDEVYNLAAQSFVPTSWTQPVLTAEFTARRRHPPAGGDPPGQPGDPLLPGLVAARCSARCARRRRTRRTPFYPRSPYGVAKVYGHYITVNYRESLRPVRLLGDPLQPRVAAPRPGVRDAQGHRRRGPHQARPGRRR